MFVISLADEKPDGEPKVDRLVQVLKGTSNKRSCILLFSLITTTLPLLQVNKSQHHLHRPFLPQGQNGHQ